MKRLTAALSLLTALACTAAASADTQAFIKGDYAKQRVVPYVTIPDGKITVDGDLSDWADVPVRDGVVDDVFDHTIGSLNGNVRGAATFRFAHDSKAFYAAVQVADSSIIPSRDQNIWNGDATEFFLDFRPIPGQAGALGAKHYLGDSDYTDGTAQILVAGPVDGQPVRQLMGTLGGAPLGPYDVATKTCPGGYCVELRIPFTSIPGVAPGRMTREFGFDVSIDDIDAVPGGNISERRSFAWSGDGDQWQDASSFGLADPQFDNATIPAPLLRTEPAVYARRADVGLDGKGDVIIAGDIVPIGTPSNRSDYAVEVDPAVQGVFDGKATVESTDYPGLGVTVRRTWWPADKIPDGKYKVVTSYNAGLRQAVRVALGHSNGTKTAAVRSFPAGTNAPDKTVHGAYLLPNGVRISPVGKQIPLPGDMPQSFVWLDRTHLAVNTGGYHDQGVDVVDVATNKVIQTLPLHQTFGSMALHGGFLIVPAGSATKSTPSGTFDHALSTYLWSPAKLTMPSTITFTAPGESALYTAGVAAARGEKSEFFTVNIDGDKIYRIIEVGYNAAGVVRTDHGFVSAADTAKTGYRPFALTVSPDGGAVAVANWGDKSVSLFDTATLYNEGVIKVGSHPVALSYTKDGRLFVVCSGSNEVDVIDRGRVSERIKTSLDPRDIVGSTPDALAISPDGRRLYVANADNNDICVVDVSVPGESRVVGFIPTGWYPSAITVSPDGKKLYIGIGKGLSFSANPDRKYIATILNGAVSVVDVPLSAQLKNYTQQVAADFANSFPAVPWDNSPSFRLSSNDPRDLSMHLGTHRRDYLEHNLGGLRGKIKHILYIIRENRTYDQVLGDDPRGNGDPNIVMFGKDVTPNAHKLADNFVLLDNLYCSGEVSENGHQWCDSAYATDFVQRAWPQSYSGKAEPDADDRLTESPAGFLWDNCARHGVSYYAYGEGASFTASPDRPPVFNGEGALKGHSNPRYGVDYWNKRDTVIDQYFISDLHKAEKTGKWPSFMIMSLPEDHTHGLGAGSFTPAACVASNDQALGQIVDAISHSRFWKSTAIFVIEDDAQDGPDHVDAHRTVGLVISPYIRHGYVDHTLYTTASYVRTIEDILGLPYMTQFDENATPLADAFDTTPVLTAYTDVAPKIDVMAKNQAGPAAVESAKLDFSAPDRIDPATYNRLLWEALKPGIPMPAPVRRGLIAAR